MKKVYTVDELLKPKEAISQPEPTKLQHLKIGEGYAKMDDINRIIKGIEEQDAEEEKVLPDKKMSNKEIYDLVVETLKADGHEVNKANIDYLTKVVKDVHSNKPPEKEPFKFVNPYV